ncbi:AraC family transcriptional regulator [Pedobacter yulinensis]|uniref:AraC family transcriptional regulator n=1 Tax=Pedobacter yulinensis TaxID=2126353 RepID=A0A2T3HKU2_9SPHI|nr:helix-turn-helix domain-containing protein [Pedobacter yulinensis]PST83078.1 AraC family transcriptional regulator [Pedobacter yulinensis]
MKPQLLKVSTDTLHSFSARRDTAPDINNRWHYHEETELIYVRKGTGTQFIGDSMLSFKPGDVVLVGSNLPHYWRFDEEYFRDGSEVEVWAIHFKENFFGQAFLELPENHELRKVLEQSRRGVRIGADESVAISAIIRQLTETEGTTRLIRLLEALTSIARAKDKTLLASLGFRYNFQDSEKDRIQSIYNYSITNFKKKIQLAEIAEVARVSHHSFCKYFKSKSGKTYSRFINEIRVGHACKLLIESRMTVKEVCYESGFYNFASFHKYFKEITGKSPLSYQKTFVS